MGFQYHKSQGKRFKHSVAHYTPSWLANWIYDYTLSTLGPPNLVLDPCIGIGSMTDPFKDSTIIGIDTAVGGHLWCDSFMHTKFETLQDWPYEVPDLILCNPPFNGHPKNMMYPEVFARHLITLFGTNVPIWMIVPHTFRLTPSRSSRRDWLNSGSFNIVLNAALPTDCFSNSQIHCELLLVNANIVVAQQPVLNPIRLLKLADYA